jgi:hypothetical protein
MTIINRKGRMGEPISNGLGTQGTIVSAAAQGNVTTVIVGMPWNDTADTAPAAHVNEQDNAYVAGGGTKTLKIVCDRDWKASELAVASECAAFFDIVQVKYQNVEYLPSGLRFPATLLSEVAVDKPQQLWEDINVQATIPLYLTVRNKDADIQEFKGGIYGDQLTAR